MAAQILSNAKLWVQGFDWTGDVNALALKYGADAKENTVLGAGTRTRLAGLQFFSFAHRGFWNGGNNNVDDAIWNSVFAVNDAIMSIDPAGSGVEGDLAYTGQCELVDYKPGAKVGDMLEFEVAGDSDGAVLVRGTLMANRTVTVTGNGSIFQLGAVGAAQKMYASLHVLQGVAGTTPTLNAKLQSAPTVGFAAPVDRIVFPQMTGSGALWGTPLAGAITDQYWRFVWTIGGTAGPSFPIVGVAGFR